MEKYKKNRRNINKNPPNLNGNGSKLNTEEKQTSSAIKDQIVTNDGRVFYPCQYCNKVFSIKKTRSIHIKNCSAKDYILSVDDNPKKLERGSNTESECDDIPEAKKLATKIDIQQNVVLNEQMDASPLMSKSKSIQLTVHTDSSNENHSTNNSLVLKEKNELNEDFTTIAKRLQSNSVTITKQPKKTSDEDSAMSETSSDTEKSADTHLDTVCKECHKEFTSPIELLRHTRECHSYPKVVMALSEVEKFYSAKDRSECPICHKPLKTSFRSAFLKHLHTHTNDMKFSCSVCNRKFRRVDHMRAHERRHVVKNKKI